MRFLNILIILGCLAGGYWLVSSIMGPGIDVTRRRKDEPPGPGGSAPRDPGPRDPDVDAAAAARAHERDWHLILDLPANASQREIEAAYKRRLAKAEASGDSFESIRIRRAYEAAKRRGA
jgi:hypothetical protein